MARDYEQEYQDARKRVREHSTPGTHEVRKGVERTHPGYEDPSDAERILTMADAYEEDNLVVDCPDGQKTKSPTTLKNYLTALNKVAPHVVLTETSATELNTVMQGFFDGEFENVKDEGLGKGSMRIYQNALRQFYYVHDDLGVDPEDISLYKTEEKAVDPADMLTREEIQAIRDAADCMRDRALFDFLIYTGQRNTATRSLRIKDLDLENGRFRLNTDVDGLKNADENGKWRDLLLSAATVQQYLSTEHPAPDDPEAYVFVARPKYGGPKPRTMLDVTTLGSIVGRLADRAAEELPSIEGKPTYPHALRHNFVTIALRRGMDETAIKHQIGHSPDSSVMESTYSHLKDSDHIRAAREAFDLEVDEPESELTPEVCPRCGESPPASARLCPWCGLAFTPDAEAVMEKADDAVRESYREVEPDDEETLEKIQVLDELLEDAEVKRALLERVDDK
jgi:integrase